MIYFETKSDLRFFLEYQKDVLGLLEIEARVEKAMPRSSVGYGSPHDYQAAIQKRSLKEDGYAELRGKLAKNTPRAKSVAHKYGENLNIKSFPPAAVGGPVIPINLLDAILNNNSWGGVKKQMILDGINATVGRCELYLEKEFKQLINPLYWIKQLVVFIIRVPFICIQLSGWNASKIEDHFISKLFKLVEIVVLIMLLIWLGLEKTDIAALIVNYFSNGAS